MLRVACIVCHRLKYLVSSRDQCRNNASIRLPVSSSLYTHRLSVSAEFVHMDSLRHVGVCLGVCVGACEAIDSFRARCVCGMSASSSGIFLNVRC